ncbi:glutamine--fructose-6-phosphate transaminase (isomerizing) [Halorubrum sp. JWXQ-INN 858]|uniref:glutamine--fructose-6-phosphate transaminase (isomerizing) n=1 Tax=Halorubrum sp. JWXQ-INN 858 TaxID=2690782 RepID=UPI0013570705|nr:glutamine--fructose-6-phosphate transaminase (isomerizing) [Halorubrum sp. JWXQ-INN 858]MWV65248.1 glutamine--fructose-6-phosphate transaminase (isomerizing) [Halorubrum sp. JWXQ-INN 858]
MCGIVGYVGDGDATRVLLSGLNQLEYRGYDSAGIAVSDGGGEICGDGGVDANGGVSSDGAGIDVRKRAGELENLEAAIESGAPTGSVGIGHTRWSTHGPPTDRNAHPHTGETGAVAVVHNGIIENYRALKEALVDAGRTFESDTDTEVVPHLIEQALADGADPETAFRRAVSQLEGSYAIVAVFEGVDALFAARNDSPLVLGVGDDGYHVASDVPAFLEFTERVVYLEDGETVVVRGDGATVRDGDGDVVEKAVTTVDWDVEDTGKSGYDHYMLKEIHEQPTALRQCLSGRVNELDGTVELPEVDGVPAPSTVHLVACGTSYHAALVGAARFREAGTPAQAFLASEYAVRTPPVGDALVIGVTQSGETADTLAALRAARSRGARTLAVTNVVGSSAARECDDAVYIRAGPEIGVAATKTFTSQVVSLSLLVERLAGSATGSEASRERLAALRDLPGLVQQVLDESAAAAVAEAYVGRDGYFFIGRGPNHPVALEGALKFKEITYEHAEGFAAGELKHGTLALVTERTPVIAVVTGDDAAARKTVSNVKEVEARGAPVIAVTDGRAGVAEYADHTLALPDAHPSVLPLLANTQLQLVAYHVANRLGRSIDKPRNLAKSVTVE